MTVNFLLAGGSLVVGMMTGAVVAVAYLHRTFALKQDVESISERFEADVRYMRDRVDKIFDTVRGR